MKKRFGGSPSGSEAATIFVALTLCRGTNINRPRVVSAPDALNGNVPTAITVRAWPTFLTGRGAQGLPPCQGSGAALLRAAGLALGPRGSADRWWGGKRALTRSALAAALAALLPFYGASAQEAQADATRAPDAAEDRAADGKATQLDTIVVTGTRIKGGTTPSPVITIGSERIQEEGFTDLGEVIRSVSQNFSGGQNPGVIGAVSGLGNQDLTGGSALNLRGLGADASLTLLNGRRMAYDGFSQAVDISAIPVEAVERLEIIPDGASALYGSDAVGGVANVILKRDFKGVALSAGYGGATSGGLGTREYNVTAGTTWASGGLMAALRAADVDPISADQRTYTRYLPQPYTIYNASDARSGLVTAHQALGDGAELHLDAMRTERDMIRYITVPGAYYRYTPQTEISVVAPSATFFLGSDWSVTVGGALGRNENMDVRHYVTAASTQLISRTCYCNKSNSYEVGLEGPLYATPAGEVRLATGAGLRRDELAVVAHVSGRRYGGGERARFAYAELGLPVVSDAMGIPGVRRLEFSAAVRTEDYDSFGQVTTPKLGVLYDPSSDLTIKVSWGKSFKAPTLQQRYTNRTAYLYSASTVGGSGFPADATALMSYGGNADLRAERAQTLAASLALHPGALPGLDAELTWFAIDYRDRVVQPVNYMQALSDPIYADFVERDPTQQQMDALLANYGSAFYNYANAPYDEANVVAIIRDQYVNAARQKIRGVDLTGSYLLELGSGTLTARGSASWLDSAQQNSAGQPKFDLAGTLSNPARFNSRLGMVWIAGGLSASGFANYTSGVVHRLATTTEKTASFTTVDATLRYQFGAMRSLPGGLSLALSVQNLFNRSPPLHTPPNDTYVPYDATNYSAIGRFANVTVSAQW
ncbi:TonB-dependent receptor [Pseudoxanthomonas sp. JBR18]|uniref:TonB-dependent receptor plug domain-containing protein n=1 Tax=Pseudoxanthomonas sp. JBR18 TaxID=2969308 RepID=UPI00230683C2|nr:TonB-dependent receptor [Pseudoxanthomonas sp. JBR18]WCE06216.1 TonB-dependent receptor [Pseudoxanthomonas sp. JBR18]